MKYVIVVLIIGFPILALPILLFGAIIKDLYDGFKYMRKWNNEK